MPEDPADLFALVRRELETWLAPDDTSREARILRRWERKRRALRGHARSFVVVNGFIFLSWLTLAASLGLWFPWFMFPLLGWGMGFTMHWLGHRSWVTDHQLELRRAREKLGLVTPPPGESSWDRLESRCQTAVAEAREAIQRAERVDAQPLLEQLEAGERQLTELLQGARAIDEAFRSVAPGGVASVDDAIAELERRHGQTAEPGTRGALEQKRALLQSRRAKLDALRSEQDRVTVTADGFALAAENMRLDVLRLSRETGSRAELENAVSRLQDELEVLERVHRELADL